MITLLILRRSQNPTKRGATRCYLIYTCFALAFSPVLPSVRHLQPSGTYLGYGTLVLFPFNAATAVIFIMPPLAIYASTQTIEDPL